MGLGLENISNTECSKADSIIIKTEDRRLVDPVDFTIEYDEGIQLMRDVYTSVVHLKKLKMEVDSSDTTENEMSLTEDNSEVAIIPTDTCDEIAKTQDSILTISNIKNVTNAVSSSEITENAVNTMLKVPQVSKHKFKNNTFEVRQAFKQYPLTNFPWDYTNSVSSIEAEENETDTTEVSQVSKSLLEVSKNAEGKTYMNSSKVRKGRRSAPAMLKNPQQYSQWNSSNVRSNKRSSSGISKNPLQHSLVNSSNVCVFLNAFGRERSMPKEPFNVSGKHPSSNLLTAPEKKRNLSTVPSTFPGNQQSSCHSAPEKKRNLSTVPSTFPGNQQLSCHSVPEEMKNALTTVHENVLSSLDSTPEKKRNLSTVHGNFPSSLHSALENKRKLSNASYTISGCCLSSNVPTLAKEKVNMQQTPQNYRETPLVNSSKKKVLETPKNLGEIHKRNFSKNFVKKRKKSTNKKDTAEKFRKLENQKVSEKHPSASFPTILQENNSAKTIEKERHSTLLTPQVLIEIIYVPKKVKENSTSNLPQSFITVNNSYYGNNSAGQNPQSILNENNYIRKSNSSQQNPKTGLKNRKKCADYNPWPFMEEIPTRRRRRSNVNRKNLQKEASSRLSDPATEPSSEVCYGKFPEAVKGIMVKDGKQFILVKWKGQASLEYVPQENLTYNLKKLVSCFLQSQLNQLPVDTLQEREEHALISRQDFHIVEEEEEEEHIPQGREECVLLERENLDILEREGHMSHKEHVRPDYLKKDKIPIRLPSSHIQKINIWNFKSQQKQFIKETDLLSDQSCTMDVKFNI